MGKPNRLELFHLIAEPESAAVRRRLTELGLMEQVDMRNVSFESHRGALQAHGGQRTPALWDGSTLHTGAEAIFAALQGLSARPRDH